MMWLNVNKFPTWNVTESILRRPNPIFAKINTILHVVHRQSDNTHKHKRKQTHTHNSRCHWWILWDFEAYTFGKWFSMSINDRVLAERKRPLAREQDQPSVLPAVYFAVVQISSATGICKRLRSILEIGKLWCRWLNAECVIILSNHFNPCADIVLLEWKLNSLVKFRWLLWDFRR